MIDRLKRIAELLRREISVILQIKIDDPIIADVTITKVEVAKDLSLAKIYFETLQDDNDIAQVAKALKSHARFIRGELAHNVSLKRVPKLSFREDIDEKTRRHIDAILEKIKTEQYRVDSDPNPEKGEKDEF